jgi:hypothetical protein
MNLPIKSALFLIFSMTLMYCKQSQHDEAKSYPPASEILTAEQIEDFKYSIIRFMGKIPPKADHESKFDTIYDDYYRKLAQRHDLEYYTRLGDTVYFLVTRIAPSMYEKKVAIGGKLIYDKEGDIGYYEEIFRTWRMLVPELKEKSALLYDLMVRGKDLSPYYTANSKGVEYIEFPDENVHFDTALRRWVSDRQDLLEEYRAREENQ